MSYTVFFAPSRGVGVSLDKPGTYHGRSLQLVTSSNPYLQWARELFWLKFFGMTQGRVLRYNATLPYLRSRA